MNKTKANFVLSDLFLCDDVNIYQSDLIFWQSLVNIIFSSNALKYSSYVHAFQFVQFYLSKQKEKKLSLTLTFPPSFLFRSLSLNDVVMCINTSFDFPF